MSAMLPNEQGQSTSALSNSALGAGRDVNVPRHDDALAAALRGLGPVGLFAILVIVLTGNVFVGGFAFPLGGLMVLVWALRSRTPLREIGFVRP
ncbi:MAG: hypothetical protein ACT4P6_03505 [Gemmatimonadaceae bacterium]